MEIALLSAKKAFQNWASSSIEVRQNWMAKLRDEVVANENFLRECVHFEMGSPGLRPMKIGTVSLSL